MYNFEAKYIILNYYKISWKRKIALPGISDSHNFFITVQASSAENSVCGGGSILKENCFNG